MFTYDLVAILLIGISHVLFYLQLIRYDRFSFPMVILLSSVFTVLLGIIVTVTGYPEFNIVMVLLFLLSLGLMKKELTFAQNLYFALVSMVIITLVKMAVMELSVKLFMFTSFNLYIWTESLIHLIVSAVILSSIILWRKSIQKLAKFIVNNPLYYISYVLLIIGLVIELTLTLPATNVLAALHHQYGQASYIVAYILFFTLLLIVLLSAHLMKARMLDDQQEQLDHALLDYVRKLEVMHEELASFRHDYTNVLLALDEGIRTKNIAQIERVYKDVIKPTSIVMDNHELDIVKLSRIAVPEVKSVVHVKVMTAKQQQLNMQVDIPETIHEIFMPVIDFIRAISIIVDNAIEEAIHSKEKVIQLAFFELEERQFFIVRNSSKHKTLDLQRIYEKRYTSKPEPINEGYGLFSLKRIIDKTTNATLETTFTAPYFTQVLIVIKES